MATDETLQIPIHQYPVDFDAKLFYNVQLEACGDMTMVPMETRVHVHLIWKHDSFTWLAKASVPSDMKGWRCEFIVNMAGLILEGETDAHSTKQQILAAVHERDFVLHPAATMP